MIQTFSFLFRKSQEKVLNALSMAESDVLVFYNDDVSFKQLLKFMKSDDKEHKELLYHIKLVELLAACAEVKHNEKKKKKKKKNNFWRLFHNSNFCRAKTLLQL